uniref:Isoaspartyl peptidase/L-asparaginase-like n=1 Tax=Nelumbo nucifera TaxID=4432 RepID=A0A822YE49_NELNU|nr:TPA_asm: hypothetical protein HUJ06_009274 [Nelumbo nucifera]
MCSSHFYGGIMNKSGRIGDSPLIGAGTYACDICAVSCTGEGEAIIRATLARYVAAVMEYKGLEFQDAVDYVIKKRLDEGKSEDDRSLQKWGGGLRVQGQHYGNV